MSSSSCSIWGDPYAEERKQNGGVIIATNAVTIMVDGLKRAFDDFEERLANHKIDADEILLEEIERIEECITEQFKYVVGKFLKDQKKKHYVVYNDLCNDLFQEVQGAFGEIDDIVRDSDSANDKKLKRLIKGLKSKIRVETLSRVRRWE